MSGPALIDGVSYYQFDICYSQYFSIDGVVYGSIAEYIKYDIYQNDPKLILKAYENIVDSFNDYKEILFNSKDEIFYPYAVDNNYNIILNAIRAKVKGKTDEYQRLINKIS